MIYIKNFLRIIFVLLFSGWIYLQLKQYGGYKLVESFSWNQTYWLYFLVVIALVPANWYLESLKWQMLMSPYKSIDIREAFKAVLAGVSLGLVTPGRVGEYGGRLLLTPVVSRAGIVTATFVGSVAQNIWNISVGLVLSIPMINLIIGETKIAPASFYIIAISQSLALIFIYFYMDKIVHFISHTVQSKRWTKHLARVGQVYDYNKGLLFTVLLLSAFRYGLYFIQYGCMIRFLGADVAPINILTGVGTIYLIQSIVPLPSYLSIMARGELAILVWKMFGVSPIIALIATFGLWVTNLILPSLFGFITLLKADLWSIDLQKILK